MKQQAPPDFAEFAICTSPDSSKGTSIRDAAWRHRIRQGVARQCRQHATEPKSGGPPDETLDPTNGRDRRLRAVLARVGGALRPAAPVAGRAVREGSRRPAVTAGQPAPLPPAPR